MNIRGMRDMEEILKGGESCDEFAWTEIQQNRKLKLKLDQIKLNGMEQNGMELKSIKLS